ncbi:MAG: glycosyltransferase [Nitrospirae bacterium]|nr:glycosyltransferase [Nitrospirota bacterium]
MKLISILTPCYNEEDNIRNVYTRVKEIISGLRNYRYEHIFIDNSSRDRTVPILKEIAAQDKNVKVIVNMKNFGVYRSPIHGLFQTRGDAVIPLAADFQDPPELISEFVKKWEEGYKIVAAVKSQSLESPIMRGLRNIYYRTISYLSEDSEQIRNFTGYGLYDREVIELIKSTGDHYPYVRGLIGDMGYDVARVEYTRPVRKFGLSKNSLYDLYGQAMNGITHHSKIPLRLATFVGFFMSFISMMLAFAYGIYKLIYWQSFTLGLAPLVIGLFFFASVQLISLGIIGEYIGAIYSRLFQRWLVIEKERINFDK